MAGKVREAFLDFDVPDVRPSDVASFVDDNFSNHANAANKYKALLSLIFAFGIRKGWRDDNPCREVRGYSESTRKRYLSDDELARIRAALVTGADGRETRSGPMMLCLMDLACITGQRIGDLLALQWSQVRPEGILFQPACIDQGARPRKDDGRIDGRTGARQGDWDG